LPSDQKDRGSWKIPPLPVLENSARSETAARLGMTDGAVKVAVHRLRQRYRELLRAEIAETVTDPSDIDVEMRHLVAALRRKQGLNL